MSKTKKIPGFIVRAFFEEIGVKTYDNLEKKRVKPFPLNLPIRLIVNNLVACYNGSATVDCEQQHFKMKAGDILLMAPGIVVDNFTIQPGSSFFGMTIDRKRFPISRNDLKVSKKFFNNTILVTASPEQLEIIKSAYLLISQIAGSDTKQIKEKEGAMRGCMSVLSNIFTSLAPHEDSAINQEVTSARSADIVVRFMKDVSEHFAKHRDIAFYANRLCVSPKYLGNIVQSIKSMSPKEIITNRTILETKMMLTHTNLSIKEIAEALHFKTQSAFSRYFKNATGLSPTEFANLR